MEFAAAGHLTGSGRYNVSPARSGKPRLVAVVLSTRVVYPITYDGLVAAEPVSVLVLTTPNALLVKALEEHCLPSAAFACRAEPQGRRGLGERMPRPIEPVYTDLHVGLRRSESLMRPSAL